MSERIESRLLNQLWDPVLSVDGVEERGVARRLAEARVDAVDAAVGSDVDRGVHRAAGGAVANRAMAPDIPVSAEPVAQSEPLDALRGLREIEACRCDRHPAIWRRVPVGRHGRRDRDEERVVVAGLIELARIGVERL
jgi:hypothetical protein